jgi:hypothetical protein
VERVGILASQFTVGDALSGDLRHGESEALGVVGVQAVIKTKGLFVHIAKQMKRLNRNVGSAQGPLQEAPEVFQPVGMDAPANVGFGMVSERRKQIDSSRISHPTSSPKTGLVARRDAELLPHTSAGAVALLEHTGADNWDREKRAPELLGYTVGTRQTAPPRNKRHGVCRSRPYRDNKVVRSTGIATVILGCRRVEVPVLVRYRISKIS